MKIQFLNGGLANQTFQYIFARYAELKDPENGPWYLDDSFFFVNSVHNGYELEKVFNIQPNLLSKYFDEDVWKYMIDKKRNENKSIPQLLLENGLDIYMLSEMPNNAQFNPFSGTIEKIGPNKYIPELTSLSGDVYYHGYWINKGYFNEYKDIFLKELAFRDITEEHNVQYADLIAKTESVCIHVRRGDFINIGWALSEDEIRELVSTMHGAVPNMTLFVFSDDMRWCKENERKLGFNIPKEVFYIEGNEGEKSYRDMQLMSMCKNMIIGTSSFNYLAALLNRRLERVINTTNREV